MNRLLGRVVVLGAVLALAACGSASTRTTDGAETTTTASAAALRGQTVTLLTHDAFAVSKPVLAAFTAQTGIRVKVVQQGDAGAMVNAAILTRDHPQADVLFGVDTTFVSRALTRDLFESRAFSGLDALDPAARAALPQADDRVVPIDYGDVCVNTDLTWFRTHGIPAPTTLADLVEPRYKNLLVVENPASSSPGLAFLLATISSEGADGWEAYWQALRRNGVSVADSWSVAYEQEFTAGGANGTRPLVVSYASSPPADVVFATDDRAAPHIGTMTNGCFRQYEYAGVLHAARHPDAGQRLVEFMISQQFQADMPLQMYVFPTRRGTPLPDVFERFAAIPPNPLSMESQRIESNRDTWIARWTELVTG